MRRREDVRELRQRHHLRQDERRVRVQRDVVSFGLLLGQRLQDQRPNDVRYRRCNVHRLRLECVRKRQLRMQQQLVQRLLHDSERQTGLFGSGQPEQFVLRNGWQRVRRLSGDRGVHQRQLCHTDVVRNADPSQRRYRLPVRRFRQ